MSQIVLEPDIQDTNGAGSGRWMVVIFNNTTNAYEDVIQILMTATGCDIAEAEMETWEAHHYGKASVHFGEREECEEAARIISSIGVKSVVTPEWAD